MLVSCAYISSLAYMESKLTPVGAACACRQDRSQLTSAVTAQPTKSNLIVPDLRTASLPSAASNC